MRHAADGVLMYPNCLCGCLRVGGWDGMSVMSVPCCCKLGSQSAAAGLPLPPRCWLEAGMPRACCASQLRPTFLHPRSPTSHTLPSCSNIACNCEETQQQIVAAGALPVLCELLAPTSEATPACREAAAWTLSNLACAADVRAQLGCARWLPGAALSFWAPDVADGNG